MRTKPFILLMSALSLIAMNIEAQQTVKVTSSGIGYLEYLPQDYNKNSNNYPIVISLHGIKEKGTSSTDPNLVKNDVPKVANVGLPKYVKYGQQYPFILISPQLKSNHSRWTGPFIMDVLNHVKKYLRIDNRRIYLTGLSLGGGGVWTVAAANPTVFAAIVPICSGYNELSKACALSKENVATWAFHGDKDYVVSYTVSQKMVNAMNSCSVKPNPMAKFTIFPGMNHIIWDKVYKQTNALSWMLSIYNGTSPTLSTSTGNTAPVVSAGSDKSITLPSNSVAIQASASDPDGSIASYQWAKLSGGTVSMSGTSSSKLSASNMAEGTYTFRITVKDNKGASKYDDVKVYVKSSTTTTTTTSNIAPTVTAGPDKSTTNKGFTVVGYASDKDGSIASWAWTKVSGPGCGMGNANTSKLWAYNLVSGTYVFRLTVKDNKGAVRSDDMKLVVNNGTTASTSTYTTTASYTTTTSSNVAPTVTAGPDKTTYNSGFTLVGYATDKDGSIKSVNWKKISGPSLGMKNTNTAKAWTYNLVPGTYVFRFTAVDNDGASRYDDMKLIVK